MEAPPSLSSLQRFQFGSSRSAEDRHTSLVLHPLFVNFTAKRSPNFQICRRSGTICWRGSLAQDAGFSFGVWTARFIVEWHSLARWDHPNAKALDSQPLTPGQIARSSHHGIFEASVDQSLTCYDPSGTEHQCKDQELWIVPILSASR